MFDFEPPLAHEGLVSMISNACRWCVAASLTIQSGPDQLKRPGEGSTLAQ